MSEKCHFRTHPAHSKRYHGSISHERARLSYVKSPTAAHVQRNRAVKAEFQYNPCMRRPAEGLCLWIQWTTTIATKPHLRRHDLRSHGNEKLIEESHDLAFLVTTLGRI